MGALEVLCQKTLTILHSGELNAPICALFASIYGVNVLKFVKLIVLCYYQVLISGGK